MLPFGIAKAHTNIILRCRELSSLQRRLLISLVAVQVLFFNQTRLLGRVAHQARLERGLTCALLFSHCVNERHFWLHAICIFLTKFQALQATHRVITAKSDSLSSCLIHDVIVETSCFASVWRHCRVQRWRLFAASAYRGCEPT